MLQKKFKSLSKYGIKFRPEIGTLVYYPKKKRKKNPRFTFVLRVCLPLQIKQQFSWAALCHRFLICKGFHT
jgi:hypothetical protein